MAFSLPELGYSFDSLEPYIDAVTVELHHNKHHLTYLNNLNTALEKHPEFFTWDLEKLLTTLDDIPEDIRIAVQNNGGGVYNHNFYWSCMTPDHGQKPEGELHNNIEKKWNDFGIFKSEFEKAGLGRFGSGYAWLSATVSKALVIHSTPYQDSPIQQGLIPLLVVDVWEHAYYLKYQNRRGEYLTNWWNLVNWRAVENRYLAIK